MPARTWDWQPLDDEGTALTDLIRVLNRRMTALSQVVTALLPSVGTFAAGDTTPSVGTAPLWLVSNPAPTSITALGGGVAGKSVLLWATNGNTTLVHSAALDLLGGVNVTMASGDVRSFATADGVNWRET